MQIRKYLLTLLLPCVAPATGPEVVTTSGKVSGFEMDFEGKKVNVFLGIPYAEKPVGELRFKKAVPVKPWNEPLNATSYSMSCVQKYPYAYPWVDLIPGKSEDCLYLNIWVPKGACRKNPKSVMFWIHGGGLYSGSGRLRNYRGHVLAAKGDVIVVTINYRLGIFGFLFANSTDAPGNMGFLDSLEALKWINKNIPAFGGDKEKMTIYGQSAGAVTVGYLIVSPLSKGLFKSCIMESGCENPTISGGVDPRQRNLQIGQAVAEALGCASNDTTIENNPSEVVRCLRTKGADDIVDAVYSILNPSETFLPVYGDEFMPLKLFAAVKQGKAHSVRLMIGNVQDEAPFVLTSSYPEVFGPYGEKDPRINATYAKYLINNSSMGYEKFDEIADYYIPEGFPEYAYEAARRQAYYAIGDFFFFCPLVYFADMLSAQQHDVYYYYYNHRSDDLIFAPWMGVTHYAEIPFVFGRPFDTVKNYTKAEASLSKDVIWNWTNYAKYGVPSKEWKKYPGYVKNFTIPSDNRPNYVATHFKNCQYLRPYYEDAYNLKF